MTHFFWGHVWDTYSSSSLFFFVATAVLQPMLWRWRGTAWSGLGSGLWRLFFSVPVCFWKAGGKHYFFNRLHHCGNCGGTWIHAHKLEMPALNFIRMWFTGSCFRVENDLFSVLSYVSHYVVVVAFIYLPRFSYDYTVVDIYSSYISMLLFFACTI